MTDRAKDKNVYGLEHQPTIWAYFALNTDIQSMDLDEDVKEELIEETVEELGRRPSRPVLHERVFVTKEVYDHIRIPWKQPIYTDDGYIDPRPWSSLKEDEDIYIYSRYRVIDGEYIHEWVAYPKEITEGGIEDCDLMHFYEDELH